MATQTSNLGLTKPAYSETADIADINNNMDKVDAAVHGVQNGMAILANGNVHSAVTSGQYVYVRNHGTLAEGLYTATTNISTNATLSTSNLTAVPNNGALNTLRDDVTSLNSKFTINETLDLQSSELNSNVTWNAAYIRKVGRIAEIYIEGKSNDLISSWSQLCTGLAQHGARWMPYQTNNAYSITIGQSTVMCNMNQDVVINTPTEIAANTNIRFRAIYLTQAI